MPTPPLSNVFFLVSSLPFHAIKRSGSAPGSSGEPLRLRDKEVVFFEMEWDSNPEPIQCRTETFSQKMTARFEIQTGLFSVDIFSLLFIKENSKITPGKANYACYKLAE